MGEAIVDKLNTIRYMGNKTHLLEYIIPAIKKITPKNGTVLDIMAGSNVVAYALKREFTIYTNDVQEYSYVISCASIVNQKEQISSITAKELEPDYYLNVSKKHYNFFEKTYSNTYFSKQQCIDIDSIRYAIEKLESVERKNLYLVALMGAMCKVQSTTGHFAQFMPSNHKRIIPLQKMNLYQEFLGKCDLYSNLLLTERTNKAFCMDYKDLLKNAQIMGDVDTIYLDSPYTQEQYSRFYHILETLVKYDSPTVNYKAKYRENRFQSEFCYKGKVEDSFKNIITYCTKNHKGLVISYSNTALLDIEKLMSLCRKNFTKVELQEIQHKHSTQGKGLNTVKEILICCTNNTT